MKKLLIVLSVIVLLGCSDKSVLLPEIQNATITEITDVSPAYIFYDETKPDSLELNKGNLIISTNWLINVDKRLTLKQVIPSIIELQEKKRNSSHKNESARNYYTCNDTSIKNLGFLDFTDVVYGISMDENFEPTMPIANAFPISVIIKSLDEIVIDSYFDSNTVEVNVLNTTLISQINGIALDDPDHGGDFVSVKFSFNRNLSFQDYISIKSVLINFKMNNVVVENNEFIY